MKVIVEPVGFVNDLIGKARKQEASERMTKHCVTAECDGGTLLYHTLTGELIYLDEKERNTPVTCNLLTEKHFLIGCDCDENRISDHVRTVAGIMRSGMTDVTDFTILTTTDCNARCFYCYEKGIRRYSMSAETAEATADFIRSSSGGKKIGISWFGGEPLFNKEAISLISNKLEKAGTAFSSHMTSNGLLFDEETIKEAVSLWRMNRVQITIDGTEEVYNRIKAYVEKQGSPYRTVIRNIGMLTDAGVRVFVRLNMNRTNFDNLMQLAGELGKLFGGNRLFCAYPVPLRAFAGEVGEFENPGDEINAYRALKEKLFSLGIGRNEKLPRAYSPTRCMADNDGNLVIFPDGRLSKCEHYCEKDVIGDIFSGVRDHVSAGAWKEKTVFDGCSDCPLYPRCVNLKKCPWAAFGCSEAVREIRISNIRDKMISEYRSFISRADGPISQPLSDGYDPAGYDS
jgi:radical SAM protein with 4Fe4S-binding SPASM domain